MSPNIFLPVFNYIVATYNRFVTVCYICNIYFFTNRGKKDDAEKKKRRRKVKEENGEEIMESGECGEEHATEEDSTGDTTYDDGIFKVTIGPQGVSGEGGRESEVDMDVEIFTPSPRMNALLAVKSGVLYLYGGIYEEGDKQVTLADFYSLDLQKLDEWNVIIQENKRLQVWEESESSGDDEGEEEGMEGACGGQEESSSSGKNIVGENWENVTHAACFKISKYFVYEFQVAEI